MGIALTDMSPTEAAAAVLAEQDHAWTRSLVDELDRAVRSQPLERLVDLWGLSNAATARIFGVSRQAFSRWLANGPPASRADAVADLVTATDVLDRYVKRERIPAVVRRPAPLLDDMSLLDLATLGDTRGVVDAVVAMFDLRRVQP